jgi:hypothetical protein
VHIVVIRSYYAVINLQHENISIREAIIKRVVQRILRRLRALDDESNRLAV